MENETNTKEYKVGVLSVLLAEVSWGVLPVYWNLLDSIPSSIIIIYRIFLVCATTLIIQRFFGKTPREIFSPLKNRKTCLRYLLAGVIITANWSLYIWAVTNGMIIQSSIGYYIQPLMVCIFGIVLYKEPLTRYKIVALVLATVSLCIIVWHYRELPALALLLALTFAVYSVIKKEVKEPALQSLSCETCFLAPLALIATVVLEIKGVGALSIALPWQYALMLLAGLMTIIPLGLFSRAATRVPLILLGLAGYLSPSISLVLGIFVYKEPFDAVQFACFAIIWAGLAYFSYGEFKTARK